MSLEETADRDVPMSLAGHLTELRSRLLKCVIAVLVLGVASLVFSKPIFGLLMRPVLDALPSDQRSLIYTSGIEEINVLMKVGLYCGLFLSTPVILWQIWGFVAPGLFPSERKMASPFIILGTIAFVGGATFCYLLMLPTMFKFLLQDPDAAERRVLLSSVEVAEEDVLRWVRLGEYARAGELAAKGLGALGPSTGTGLSFGASKPDPSVELKARLASLGRLVDAATEGSQVAGRPIIKDAMELRLEAVKAASNNDGAVAEAKLDEAAARLLAISPMDAKSLAQVWTLSKELASGKTRADAENWTRPMLTMTEQLSLVLILELALGIVFEMPLVMALLGLVGLVQARWLFKYQRHAIVAALIVAAIITPTGDPVNLALLAVPMMLCYELGVLAVWVLERRRKRLAASTDLSVR